MAVDFVQPTEVAPIEKPVFAARSDRRPRALRIGAKAAAILTALWVVGLAIGAFGFGYLPGIELPGTHHAAAPSVPTPAGHGIHGSAAAVAARAVSGIAARAQAGTLTTPSHGSLNGSPGSTSHSRSHGRSSHSSANAATPRTSNHGAAMRSTATPRGTAQGGGGSAAPGSRSQSYAAPGRMHSPSTPTPGSGSGRTTTTTTTPSSSGRGSASQKPARP